MKKMFSMTLAAALAAMIGFSDIHSASAEGMLKIEPITEVQPLQELDEFRICTGSEGFPYHKKGTLLVGPVSIEGDVKAVPYPGGGTVGCLRKLAAGEVQSAIIQLDGLAWLFQTVSPLLDQLEDAGAIMTEEWLTVCNRQSVDEEDYGDLGQTAGYRVMIGGGQDSGMNLALNVISSFDSGYERPSFGYSKDFGAALQSVKSGTAHCAVGFMDVDGNALEELDDTYGPYGRLLGVWDSDFRNLEFPGGQVYKWRYIPADNQRVDDFLDWDGSGDDQWSPSVIAQNAIVVMRSDVPAKVQSAMIDAVNEVSTVKTDLGE